jgi:CRISPR-associated DxTHG motif protein
MKTETQERLVIGYSKFFLVAVSVVGAGVLWTVLRQPTISLFGRLCVVSLVASAVSFVSLLIVYVRRAYAADMTHGINFFTLALSVAPDDPRERLAWLAARRAFASWLVGAVSMALFAIVETVAGHGSVQ